MTTEGTAPERGFLATIVDLWFDPRPAFEGIVRSPRIWAPLAAQVVLAFAFTGIWLQKVEPGEFIKNQLVESGRWDKIPPENRASIQERGGGTFRVIAGVGALAGSAVFPLLTAGALLFVFRFFYASEVDFRRSLAITLWSFLAVGAIKVPLMLLVMYLKDEWNLPPPDLLEAGPALLFDRGSTAKPLWILLQGFDLLSLWPVVLLALGFAVASRRPLGSALWGVAVPWALIVLVRATFAAF